MNANIEYIKTEALSLLKGEFPNFTVRIEEDEDDSLLMHVRVFGVPRSQVPEVKAYINRIDRQLIGDGDALLLPRIKNIDVTREYYPEYMPSENVIFLGLAGMASKIDDVWCQDNIHTKVGIVPTISIPGREIKIPCVTEELKGCQSKRNVMASAEQEFALAA